MHGVLIKTAEHGIFFLISMANVCPEGTVTGNVAWDMVR